MTRWFFPSARIGSAAFANGATNVATTVVFAREGGTVPAPGPALNFAGPGHVTGFDPDLVLREEPPPGTPDAAENVLAGI